MSMKFVNKPCQGVVRKDRRNNRNQVRRHAKSAFDVCHCASVIIQPNLSKQGVPSQSDKEVDNDENPNRKVMDLVFHQFSDYPAIGIWIASGFTRGWLLV